MPVLSLPESREPAKIDKAIRTSYGVSSREPCRRRMADHDMMGHALPAMPQPYAIPSAGSRQRHASGAPHRPNSPSSSATVMFESFGHRQ